MTTKQANKKVNTEILEAIKSDARLPDDKRQLAKHLQDMRSETKKLGQSTEPIDSFARHELREEIDTKGSAANKSDELKDQILRAIVKTEIDELKRGVGVVHGTLNFVVNTLAGVGNAVRMANAAAFETTPLGMLCPGLYPDKEATEMLHKTLEGTFVTARVLNQLNTTFNPTSPLFGVEYDPEGAALTRALAKALPERIGQELDKYAHADPEAQTAIATEAILNIVTMIETGGVGGAAKAGELSHVSSVAKLTEETAALSEMAQAAKIANAGEKLSPASTVANAASRSLEHQVGIFAALAEKKTSLKPLADKFKECLTNFNEATKPEFAVAGGGTFKGDGVVDVLQNAGKDIKASVEGTGKKIEDYVNRMVKKGDGESPNIRKRGNNEPSPEDGGGRGSREGDKSDEGRKDKDGDDGVPLSKDNHPWDVPQADIDLTNHLLKSGRAESTKAIFGHERLRRTDLGEKRRQYSWKAIGEVFSDAVGRQAENMSCVNRVGAELSNGRFTEAELIATEGLSPPAPMSVTAKKLGWEYECFPEGKELPAIAKMCEKGPWGANLFDGEGIHAVIIQFKNEATGRLRIHDFYESTKYEMTLDEFLRVWNGQSIFR